MIAPHVYWYYRGEEIVAGPYDPEIALRLRETLRLRGARAEIRQTKADKWRLAFIQRVAAAGLRDDVHSRATAARAGVG